jgi:hypothetical protein
MERMEEVEVSAKGLMGSVVFLDEDTKPIALLYEDNVLHSPLPHCLGLGSFLCPATIPDSARIASLCISTSNGSASAGSALGCEFQRASSEYYSARECPTSGRTEPD